MPRKTVAERRVRGRRDVASMRPRPDAAENSRKAVRTLDDCQASMRPRPDAAENAESTADAVVKEMALQ